MRLSPKNNQPLSRESNYFMLSKQESENYLDMEVDETFNSSIYEFLKLLENKDEVSRYDLRDS